MTDEAIVMEELRRSIHSPAIATELHRVALGLREELEQTPGSKSTQAAIPLGLYGAAPPADIGSSWVFVLRADHDHPPERHPNSIQRMFALDSAGAMEVWEGGGWSYRPLHPHIGDPGLSIPAYCWHRPARLNQVWGVVSFHTVAADALIEEVGDPATDETRASRHYIGATL